MATLLTSSVMVPLVTSLISAGGAAYSAHAAKNSSKQKNIPLPKTEEPTAMQDEEATARARRKQALIKQRERQGRASTILSSSDTLG